MNQKQPVIRLIGNSQGVIIPREVLSKMSAQVGHTVSFRADSGKLEVVLIPSTPVPVRYAS